MTALWTAAEAAAATGGKTVGWESVGGVSIDTREITPGDLFVALAGENRDGHEFVPAAFEAGAGAAMVSDPSNLDGRPLLVVDDTLHALERLGATGRARTAAKMIGVTGSVGKTSTKEMLRTALAGQGAVHAAVRSFNNHWGVPLTLARMPAATDYAVIEIGMNHAGEITPLTRLARPHVAVVINVEAVHMAAFASVEEIADAKAEIFAGLEPGGIAVLNRDNAHFDRLAAASGAEIVDFGRTARDFRLDEATVEVDTTAVRATIRGRPLAFRLGAPGVHFALNAMAVLAAIEAIGADVEKAAEALAAWTPPGGRGSRERIGAIDLIDESYNANPTSIRAALAVLAAASGRRIAMLGDMLELGPEETALHEALADAPDLAAIDTVHTCGPLMAALHGALPTARRGRHFADSAAMAEAVPDLLDAGDAVMVKGSLGARMARVTAAIRALAPAANED